jgi:hypothetical protein
VEPVVDVAPGAEENPLAVALADRIRGEVDRAERKRRDFAALRGSVLMVAQDTTLAVTLRFDHGRLTVHDGSIGIPSVTFCGDEAVLLSLEKLPSTRFLRLPLPIGRDDEANAAVRALAGRWARGELKIYGLLAHPRLIARFLRLLSRH